MSGGASSARSRRIPRLMISARTRAPLLAARLSGQSAGVVVGVAEALLEGAGRELHLGLKLGADLIGVLAEHSPRGLVELVAPPSSEGVSPPSDPPPPEPPSPPSSLPGVSEPEDATSPDVPESSSPPPTPKRRTRTISAAPPRTATAVHRLRRVAADEGGTGLPSGFGAAPFFFGGLAGGALAAFVSSAAAAAATFVSPAPGVGAARVSPAAGVAATCVSSALGVGAARVSPAAGAGAALVSPASGGVA